MQCEFKGVISALPTPYDQSQQIDMESLRKLIRFNIEQNIKGLYVGGSTGEAFLQNVAEREKILETVADESDGRLTLIAHVGGISTAESEVLAKAAKKYGYHAISAVTSVHPRLLTNDSFTKISPSPFSGCPSSKGIFIRER